MSTEQSESTFYFRAATADDGIYSGSVRATTAAVAVRQLTQKGYQPLRLSSKPIRTSWLHREIGFGPVTRLGVADCELVCRELALLLGANVPIVDALTIAASSMIGGSRTARFLALTRHGMRLGRPLSGAMENTGFGLPANLVPVTRAGEHAGSLSKALTLLSENYAETSRFSRALSSALAYPILLIVVSLLVFGLMAFFVAPSLQVLFVSMARPVPLVITVLASLAALIGAQLLPVGAVLAFLALALVMGGGRAVARGAKRLAIHLPVVGHIMKWAATRHFAATLHLYLTSGLPIATALPNALASAGFAVRFAQLRSITDDVRTGSQLATALRKSSLFPPKFIHLLEVGESSGRVPDVLASAVIEAKSKVEQRLALISSILAPILILIVGSLIGMMIFSVFSSLLQINELVS